MAAVLLRSPPIAVPSSKPGRICGGRGEFVATTPLLLNSLPAGSSSSSSSAQRCAIASGSINSSIHGRLLRSWCLPVGKRRWPRTVPFVSHSEDSDGKDESEKAWEQVLESFKQQAIKMQSLSQEAYEVYSKKAMVVLEETSKNMKIQADKASRDITLIAQEIREEGREYISAATKSSPDSVKDVIEVFSTPPSALSDVSKVHDFYLGIPYGAFLAVGGLASFMITGSTSAIRFGIILGTLLLALSVSSLRAWKKGKTSSLLLKGQAAISTIIFVREWQLLLQKPSLPTSLMTIISGAMLVFYGYRIIVSWQNRGPSLEQSSEN